MIAPTRILVAAAAALALALVQSDGCGFREAPPRGEGEPCTRSGDCEVELVCSGGVCARPFDAGPSGDFDAGDSLDAGSDADVLDAQTPDADLSDADLPDADLPDADLPDAEPDAGGGPD